MSSRQHNTASLAAFNALGFAGKLKNAVKVNHEQNISKQNSRNTSPSNKMSQENSLSRVAYELGTFATKQDQKTADEVKKQSKKNSASQSPKKGSGKHSKTLTEIYGKDSLQLERAMASTAKLSKDHMDKILKIH